MDEDADETLSWYVVTATVTLRGATAWVNARDEDEAKEIAIRAPDFDLSGAEMSDWEVTSVKYDSPA